MKVKKKTSAKKSSGTPDQILTIDNYGDFLGEVQQMINKDYAGISTQKFSKIDFVGTGNAAFDYIISNRIVGGGWPLGRIVEVYGDNASGKSLMGSLALIAAQKGWVNFHDGTPSMPGVGLLLDVELSFNPEFFFQLGGDPELLMVADRHKPLKGSTEVGEEGSKKKLKVPKDADGNEPLYVEAVYEILEKFMLTVRAQHPKVPIVIVWDSLAQTPTAYELAKGVRAVDYGKRAQRHSAAMRRIREIVKKTNSLLFIINQLRHTMAMFGPDKESVGGEAIKYAADLRIHLKKGKRIYYAGSSSTTLKNISGVQMRTQVEKTRFTPPFREILSNLFYRSGLDAFSGVYDAWTDWFRDSNGVFTQELSQEGKPKSGYWLYNGLPDNRLEEPIPFGRKTFMDMLRERSELHGFYQSSFDDESESVSVQEEDEDGEEEVAVEENEETTGDDAF